MFELKIAPTSPGPCARLRPPVRGLGFFFSSRRRHTRWPRDWSSDVCSSDLDEEQADHLGGRVGGDLVGPVNVQVREPLEELEVAGSRRRVAVMNGEVPGRHAE